MQREKSLNALRRILDVEYRFILYYPRLARMMPDEDTALKVEALGNDSVRHAETTCQVVIGLGGESVMPTLAPLPEPIDLVDLFRIQLEYEKLALWLHSQMVALLPAELAPCFQTIAGEERSHITWAEDVLRRLKAGPPTERRGNSPEELATDRSV